MKLGKYLSQYVQQEQAKGRDIVSIMRDDAATHAHGLDQDAGNKAFAARSKNDHLAGFLRSRAEQGLPPHFESQEEMLAAIHDPEYARSPAYRDAVAAIIKQTPAEVIGVSGHVKTSDGQTVKVGRDGLHEQSTPETMLRAAYVEMVREKLGQIDRKTATGRYEYLKMLQDPANAEVIAEIEGMLLTPEQLRRNDLMAAKAEGGDSLRVQGGQEHQPHPKDINFQTQSYADGSPLPLGDANVDGSPI